MAPDALGAAIAVSLGLGLGLSLAAPPGPMNALIARTAATHGPRRAIIIGVGAPVADVLFLVVLLFGLHRFLEDEPVVRTAAALGALLMAYFAWGAWRERGTTADLNTPTAPTTVSDAATRLGQATFPAALLAALSNPYQIGWWLTGGYAFLQAQGLWGIGGFLVGIFVWVVIFSLLVADGAKRWPRLRGWINVASALLLAFFAVLLAAVAAAWV